MVYRRAIALCISQTIEKSTFFVKIPQRTQSARVSRSLHLKDFRFGHLETHKAFTSIKTVRCKFNNQTSLIIVFTQSSIYVFRTDIQRSIINKVQFETICLRHVSELDKKSFDTNMT